MRGKSKGFTLVELSVVIAILAVLLVIAVPRFSSAREDSAKEVCHANRAMIAKTYQLALTKDSSITLQNFIDNPEKYGDYYKLVTKKEYKEYIERLVEIDNSNSLTEATLETLAIIAYNEPVTRIKVDEIRGVSSSHMIRKLVNCGLVKELGRSDLPGRPNLYGTTPLFLDHFGLKCIEELPKLTEIDSVESDEVDLFKSKYSEEKNV